MTSECRRSRRLHDPTGAAPGLANVLGHLFSPQHPDDLAAVVDLVSHCHERDLALSLELASDLAMQDGLVCLDSQQDVGPLLLELSKNGRWVCRASA
jgi:hypothetical protein